MPEGDSIWRLTRRLHAQTAGHVVAASRFDWPSLATADVDGRTIEAVVPRGKHILHRLSGGLTLHTHLRMDGAWTVLAPGRRLPVAQRERIRVTLGLDDGRTALGIGLPVVDLLPTREEAAVVGHLGPDLLGPDWDGAEAVRRLLAHPERPIAEALLDQRNLAGIGNLYKVEVCFVRGVHPATPVGAVADLGGLMRTARRMLDVNARRGTQVTTGHLRRGDTHWAYGRAGRPCLRCGTPILFAPATGDPYRRETWWCPSCQPAAVPAS